MTDTWNYVAAWTDYGGGWNDEKVVVYERNSSGDLRMRKYEPPYYFYVEDRHGEHETIFGDKVTRAEFSSKTEYEHAKSFFRDPRNFMDDGGRCPKLFETDFTPLKRVLMENYYGVPAPAFNFALLDIEADYTREGGFPAPTNAYAIINAVTVYQSWTKKFITIAVPPMVEHPTEPGKKCRWHHIDGNNVDSIYAEMQSLIDQKLLRENQIPEIILVDDELTLLDLMLKAIAEADIISGWNSEFYDIPYIFSRLNKVNPSMIARLEHPGCRPPKVTTVNRFGSEEMLIKFSGRSHLDYMRLFQKFTFEGRVSYSLGNILQEEVGVGKIEFDGTLEQLYKQNFPKFVAYNFRDVDGIVQLDAKFKFIALANQMAHENTVVFDAVLGTVAYVETGIANHAHYVLKKIVHDKNIKDHDKVEGAIVLNPHIGLHEWIGSVDINSLYPNTIRSLNISPEKIIGQLGAKEDAWRAIKDETDDRLVLIFENGTQEVRTAKEWRSLFIDNAWAVSAYGTVFDQSSGRGVVADILGFWYAERKRLQAEKKKWGAEASRLEKLLKDDASVQAEYEYAKQQEDHYDLLQLTKKISMNSLYGALLNVAFRFGDERMGASVTASGRQITTHMMETIAFLLTGERVGLVKTTEYDEDEDRYVNVYTCDSPAVIYGDTDSCYYNTFTNNIDDAIAVADATAEGVNDSFPQFMREAFNCQPEFDNLIKAGREIVGRRGLFQAKKKYIIKVVDMEGKRVDKLKSQGSEIKKADTPKVIQAFLKHTVDMILDGKDYDTLAEYVNSQRATILKKGVNVFSLGVAKQVNNLDKYTAEYNAPGTFRSANGGKLTIPGHARAACNFNAVQEQFDKGAKPIRSGDKVLIYYLAKNQYEFKAIGIPAEATRFPDWFADNFRIDKKKTEDRMFDSKLSGVFFAAFKREVPTPQSVLTNSLLEF